MLQLFFAVIAIQAIILILQSFAKPDDNIDGPYGAVEKGEVAPPEEWFDILVETGKWNYHVEKIEPGQAHILDGRLYYFPDSTTERILNYKLYSVPDSVVERNMKI